MRQNAGSLTPRWQIWVGLGVIYLAWGATYLAMRVMVETVPAILGSGFRFVGAGLILLLILVIRGKSLRVTRRQLLSCAVIGILLPGANSLITLAEKEVPSGLAGSIVALIPLVIILWRRVGREVVSKVSYAAVALGFIGIVIILVPGGQTVGAPFLSLMTIILGVLMWTAGSYWSPKLSTPRDPFLTTALFMVLGGGIWIGIGLLAGEGSNVNFAAFSLESISGFIYLVVIGSVVGYSAYSWLLQNARISQIATHAYVNPVIAIILGWLILSEKITWLTIVGAAIIVFAVVLVVRTETVPREEISEEEPLHGSVKSPLSQTTAEPQRA